VQTTHIFVTIHNVIYPLISLIQVRVLHIAKSLTIPTTQLTTDCCYQDWLITKNRVYHVIIYLKPLLHLLIPSQVFLLYISCLIPINTVHQSLVRIPTVFKLRVHTIQICEHLVVSRYTNTTKNTDSENCHHKLILTVASSSADTARDGGYIPSCSPKIPPHIIHD
jgi:hypothetical protein